MKRIASLLALLLLAVIPARAQFNGVTAEIVLSQNQYLPGEDLQLKIRINNRSGQPVTFGLDNKWVSFDIVGENEAVADKTGEMPVKGEFTLQSGEAGSVTLNPTPYFEFRKPGHYRIGATVNIAQWKQQIVCKGAAFTVANGIPVHGLTEMQFGVPIAPGVSNTLPEIRTYSLIKVSYLDQLKLYFRLESSSGRTLRVFPLSRMLSFSEPEAQMDNANNLHVLMQTGARGFTYSIISPNGVLLARQMHQYTFTRPVLRSTDDGRIYVAGGQRVFTDTDYPPNTPEPVTARTP